MIDDLRNRANERALWLAARDPDLRRRWRRWLGAAGWTVHELPQGRGAALAGAGGPLLLDAALVSEDDLARLREHARGPLILFGRGEQAADERVAALLRAGADDFIPAQAREPVLCAKLGAHARRLWPESGARLLWSPKRRIKADPGSRQAWIAERGGGFTRLQGLRRKEFELLRMLLERPEAPVERNLLMEGLWGRRAAERNPLTLNKHVQALRRRLGRRGAGIRTVYGLGYMLEEP